MRLLLPFLLCPLAAWAAVEGSVVNQTSGTPQANVVLTLYKLGGAAMEPVKTLRTGPDGAFRFDHSVDSPHLLQTIHDGVIYSRMLQPGAPASGLTVEVFDSSSQPGAAKVTTHMVLIEPVEGRLRVNENVIFENTGKTAWNNPRQGTLRFHLPEAAGGEVSVMATAPHGVPVERPATESQEKNVRMVDFAIKPGETRFDISYSVPFESPGTFEGRALPDGAPLRVVAPRGVTIEGADLKLLGQEPSTQATIYEVTGRQYSLRIEGSGALQDPNAEMEEDSGAGLQQIRPRIYDSIGPIIGLALFILALGFLLMYRKDGPKAKHR